MLKSQVIIPLAALVFLGAGSLGANRVLAQAKRGPSLAEMIAQKFGLQKEVVSSVINQYRFTRSSERRQRVLSRLRTKLDRDVAHDKLNPTQEQALLSRLDSLSSGFSREKLKGLGPAQRRKLVMKVRSELSDWARSEGIDVPKLGIRLGIARMLRG